MDEQEIVAAFRRRQLFAVLFSIGVLAFFLVLAFSNHREMLGIPWELLEFLGLLTVLGAAYVALRCPACNTRTVSEEGDRPGFSPNACGGCGARLK